MGFNEELAELAGQVSAAEEKVIQAARDYTSAAGSERREELRGGIMAAVQELDKVQLALGRKTMQLVMQGRGMDAPSGLNRVGKIDVPAALSDEPITGDALEELEAHGQAPQPLRGAGQATVNTMAPRPKGRPCKATPACFETNVSQCPNCNTTYCPRHMTTEGRGPGGGHACNLFGDL